MRAFLVSMLAALCLAGTAEAATVGVTVTGPDGKPLAGAVVTLEVAGTPPAVPHGPYVMAQHNIAFDPHVLIVPVGATVSFPNQDRVRHHVYSFSAPRKFDLKLYGRDETKTVTFDKPGIVALGCNIHDSMGGFVFVTTARYAAVSDAAGRVAIDKVPPGRATLVVWHPAIRAKGNTMSRPVAVAANGLATAVAVGR